MRHLAPDKLERCNQVVPQHLNGLTDSYNHEFSFRSESRLKRSGGPLLHCGAVCQAEL